MKNLLYKIKFNARRLYKKTILVFKKEEYNGKIFCIGFNKTGTTTVGASLELLGYRHSSFNEIVWKEYYKKGRIDKVLKYTAKFESFDDLPWLQSDMIPIVDKKFPNSKFIYLARDEKSWQKSLYNWTYTMSGKYPNKQYIEKRLADFRKHRNFVLDYFNNRPADEFIILDVTDKMGFKKLADFLGKPTIREEFPHFNKSKTNTNIS